MLRPMSRCMLLIAFLGLLGVLGIFFLSRPVPAPGLWLDPSSMESGALQETLAYRVSLPAGYDSLSEDRYPLLLILDGTRYGDVVASNARFLERVGSPQQIPESVLNEVGYLHLGHDVDQAIRAFRKATELYPHSANTWDSLSDGYLAAGRFEDALAGTDQSIAVARKKGIDDLGFIESKRSEIAAKIEKLPQ
jgi:tetratricopeptide (TPR) repeat protein